MKTAIMTVAVLIQLCLLATLLGVTAEGELAPVPRGLFLMTIGACSASVFFISDALHKKVGRRQRRQSPDRDDPDDKFPRLAG